MTTGTNAYSFGPQLLATKYLPHQVLASDVTISTYTAPRDSIIKHFIPHVDYTLDDSWLYSLGPLGLEEDEDVENGGNNDTLKSKVDIDTSINHLSHIYRPSKRDMESDDDGRIRVDLQQQGGVGKTNHSKYGMVYQKKDTDHNNNNVNLGVRDQRVQGIAMVSGHMEYNGKSSISKYRYEKHYLNTSDTEDEDNVYANNETRNAEDILKSRKKQNIGLKPITDTPTSGNTTPSPMIRREKIRYVSDALETSSKRCTSFMNGSIEPDGSRTIPVQEKVEKNRPIKTKKEEKYFEKLRSKKTESKKKANYTNSKEKHLKDSLVDRSGQSSGSKHVNSKTKKSRSSSGKSSIDLIKDISLGNVEDVCNTVKEHDAVQSITEDNNPNIIAFNTHIKHKDDSVNASSGKIAKTVKTVLKTIPFASPKNEGSSKCSGKGAEGQRMKSKLLNPLTAQSMVMEKIQRNISHSKAEPYRQPGLSATRNNTIPYVSRTVTHTCSVPHTSKPANDSKTRDSTNTNIQSKRVHAKSRSQDNVEFRILFPRDDPVSRDKLKSRDGETACAIRRRNSFGPSCMRMRDKENTPSSQYDTAKPCSRAKHDHHYSKPTDPGSRPPRQGSHFRSKSFTFGRNKTSSDLFFHERIMPPSSAGRPKSMGHFVNRGTLLNTLDKSETSKSCDNMKTTWKSSEKWSVNNSSHVAHERIIPRSKSHGNIKSRSTSCEGVKMRCIFFKEDVHDTNGGKVKRSRSFGAASTTKQNLYVQNERIVKTSHHVSMKSEPNLGTTEESFTVYERLGMQESLLDCLQRDHKIEAKGGNYVENEQTLGTNFGVDQNPTLSDATTSKHFWRNLERGLLSLQQDLASKNTPSNFDRTVESELDRNVVSPSSMSFRNGEKLSMICEMFKNDESASPKPMVNDQTGDTTAVMVASPPPPPQGVNKISCSTTISNTTLEHEPQHLHDILSVGDFERGFHLDDVLSRSQHGCATELLGREKLKYIRIKERARELREANMNAREILNVLLLEVIRDKQSNSDVYRIPGVMNQNTGLHNDHVDGMDRSEAGHEEQKNGQEDGAKSARPDAVIQKNVAITGEKTEETLKKELKLIEELFQNIDSKKLLKELNLNDDVLKTMMRTIKREKLRKSKASMTKEYQEDDLECDARKRTGKVPIVIEDNKNVETDDSRKAESIKIEEKIEGVEISDAPFSTSFDQSCRGFCQDDKVLGKDIVDEENQEETQKGNMEDGKKHQQQEQQRKMDQHDQQQEMDLLKQQNELEHLDNDREVGKTCGKESKEEIGDEKVQEENEVVHIEQSEVVEEKLEEDISPDKIIDQEDLNEFEMLFSSLDNKTAKKGAERRKKKKQSKRTNIAIEEEMCQCVDIEEIQETVNFEVAFAPLQETVSDSFSNSSVIDPQQRTHSFINLQTISSVEDDIKTCQMIYSTVQLHDLQCEKLSINERSTSTDDIDDREDDSECSSVSDDDVAYNNTEWSYSNLLSSDSVSIERYNEDLEKPLQVSEDVELNVRINELNTEYLATEFADSPSFTHHYIVNDHNIIDTFLNEKKIDNDHDNGVDDSADADYDNGKQSKKGEITDDDDNGDDFGKNDIGEGEKEFITSLFDEEWNIDDLISNPKSENLKPEITCIDASEEVTDREKAAGHWNGSDKENKVCVKTSVLIQSDITTTSVDDQNILQDDETFDQIVERLCESVRRELPQHVNNEQLDEGVELNATVLIMAGNAGEDAIIEKESLICSEEELSQMMEELSEQVSSNYLLDVIKANELCSSYDIGINIDLARPKQTLTDNETTRSKYDAQNQTLHNELTYLTQQKDDLYKSVDINPTSNTLSLPIDDKSEPNALPDEEEVVGEAISVNDACTTCSASDNEVTFDILIPSENDDNTDLTIEIIIEDGKEVNIENRRISSKNRNDTELIQEEFHCEKRCHCEASAASPQRTNRVHNDSIAPLVPQKEVLIRDKSTPNFMKQLYEGVDIDEVLKYRTFFDPDILHSSAYMDSQMVKESLLVTDKDSLLDGGGGGSSCMDSPDVSVFSADDIDSGTDLQYDDLFSPTESNDNDNDNDTWLINVKPLLVDSEVVANLFVRLSNKHNEFKTLGNIAYSMQQIHMATTAYEVITHNNLTNFAHVLSHLLSFLGLIKCEKEPPGNVSAPNILIFLQQLVENASLSTFHITILTVLLAKTNERLKKYHSLRVDLLHACFVQEMRRLKITSGELHHITICFIKISEYFIHLDRDLSCTLIDDYILPNLTKHNSAGFIDNVLQYMGLVSASERTGGGTLITATDISSSLVLLSLVLKRRTLPSEATKKLSKALNSDHLKFKFCEDERRMLLDTLNDLKYT